ncbi:type VI secretion system lipoprotein TssJ [Pseudescherichia sp.]|uniref:type VI secretion system lipoprotein TssJ n=1 Tax=Pseudescherichia sp. TaxID=2055881 RepID=UPI00289AD133|nr:type VI secretion system lipoprotein TssJ [Pseudescherichia sp.]
MISLIATLLSGCAASSSTTTTEQQAIDRVPTPFSQGAISLDIQTDPDLNAWHNMANSCTVLVVQAQKSSTLNKLLSSPFALKGLFSAAGAQDDILKVDRYAAMPGQRTTLHIDRSENTRYIAIVAGYYPFPKKQHMALVAIPVTSESTDWWHPVWHAQLTPLALQLRLGRDAITQLQGAPQIPVSLSQGDVAASTPQPAEGV